MSIETPSAVPAINLSALSELSAFRGSLAQRVYQSLKQAIMTLSAPPGAVLKKPDLCAHLGVSRSPISEAIARLASDGLVEIVPQSGSHVSYLSLSEIHEAAFLRAALELAAVRHVAENRTDAQIDALERNLKLQAFHAGERDFAAFFEADQAFHSQIFANTGFARAGALVQTVSLQLNRARQLILPEAGRMEGTLAEHGAILNAIRAGDGVAAQAAMEAHLDLVADRLAPLAVARPELFRDP